MFNFAQEYNVMMIVFSVIGCLLGRLLNIFPISYLINAIRPDHPVPFNHQVFKREREEKKRIKGEKEK